MTLFTSVLTAGTNSHQETSENVNAGVTDFVTPGVIGAITNTSGVAPSTGAFAVNAQGTPNMTVAVNSGVAYVTATPSSQNSQALRVRNTASTNVPISANNSGSTKYDYIYIQIDATKAANPASDASDVATLVVSRSSSNTTDNGTPPTYGYCIAMVTVANAASSITNGNITDKRVLATNSPAGSIQYTSLGKDSSWAWQTWVPVWTNLTIGNATVTARYIQEGKSVRGEILVVLGSTSSFTGGTVEVTMPVARQGSAPSFELFGIVSMYDLSTPTQGFLQWDTTSKAFLLVGVANATYNQTTGVTNTAPYTWGTPTNKTISITFNYEAA